MEEAKERSLQSSSGLRDQARSSVDRGGGRRGRPRMRRQPGKPRRWRAVSLFLLPQAEELLSVIVCQGSGVAENKQVFVVNFFRGSRPFKGPCPAPLVVDDGKLL